MKKYLLSLLFLCFQIFLTATPSAKDYSIVFIHLGYNLPHHVETAVCQARLFNKDCDIILIVNEYSVQSITQPTIDANIQVITCESLPRSLTHTLFLTNSNLNRSFRGGLWFYSVERFFYLDECIKQYSLKNVFHLENDCMLYADLSELLPTFKKYYPGMAGPFDDDKRSIPSLLYFADQDISNKFCSFTAETTYNHCDMEGLAIFKKHCGEQSIDLLPVICRQYVEEISLISPRGHGVVNKESYCNHFEEFNSIFDAAAIGQYIGGIDPQNANTGPGWVNDCSVYNPTLLTYEWIKDAWGRKVPYVTYGKTTCRLNNLHVHCKDLERFSSLNPNLPSTF